MNTSVIVVALLCLVLTACSSPEQPTIGLYPAIQRGNIDQIERHIYWGTDINQANIGGRRPLHVAAAQGELVVVKLLLKHGAEINAQDSNGRTPIYTAIMEGRTQLAALLIKHGAAFDSDVLLDQAVANNVIDRDIVRFLVESGANINHLNTNGSTPLIEAIGRDNRVLVKHLISQGADVNMPNSAGVYPFDLARERGNSDIIGLLDRNGARSDPRR